MLYRNTADKPLEFRLGKSSFKADPGGLVNIPDNIAYAVEGRGLPLVKADGGGGSANVAPPHTDAGSILDALDRALAALAPAARSVALERLGGMIASYAEPKTTKTKAPKAEGSDPK